MTELQKKMLGLIVWFIGTFILLGYTLDVGGLTMADPLFWAVLLLAYSAWLVGKLEGVFITQCKFQAIIEQIKNARKEKNDG